MSGADKSERDGPLSRPASGRRSDGHRSYEFDRAIRLRMLVPLPPTAVVVVFIKVDCSLDQWLGPCARDGLTNCSFLILKQVGTLKIQFN